MVDRSVKTATSPATDPEAVLRAAAADIVAEMIERRLAERVEDTDVRVGKPYWVLATPGAFEQPIVILAALGYPEQVGVWSYTLLGQGRAGESSMEPYFRAFPSKGLGFVAINPNCLAPDMEGSSFLYQLERVVSRISEPNRIGLLGFSMGGGMVLDFLDRNPHLLSRTAGLALIDPTLPNRLRLRHTRPLLDSDTLLIASEGETRSPGKVASALLGVPAVSFSGIHGQMPGKALDRIVEFFRKRLP